MKRLAIWVPKHFSSDNLFLSDSVLNRDDTLAPYRLLREEMLKKGWKCHTQDVFKNLGEIPEAVLFINIPKRRTSIVMGDWANKVEQYVLLNECEVIVPQNWDKKRQAEFNKLFTWHDEYIDGERHIQINFPQNLSAVQVHVSYHDKKMCALIAGNKCERHPFELYSKRIEAIKWFENNQANAFDLFGVGWDEYHFYWPRLLRVLNKIKPLVRIMAPGFPSYRGRVERKRETLSQYKFCICYENARNIPGYITEKIFDCFLAGCVPIYWGAPNVSEHIPNDCYIDRRNYDSYEELYERMSAMSQHEYTQYLSRISSFLSSDAAMPYSNQYFASTIARVIARDA